MSLNAIDISFGEFEFFIKTTVLSFGISSMNTLSSWGRMLEKSPSFTSWDLLGHGGELRAVAGGVISKVVIAVSPSCWLITFREFWFLHCC